MSAANRLSAQMSETIINYSKDLRVYKFGFLEHKFYTFPTCNTQYLEDFN